MWGKQPEVPGAGTPFYPRARRMRDTIDDHSRSAVGVSLSTSTRSDTSKSRYWVTTIRSPSSRPHHRHEPPAEGFLSYRHPGRTAKVTGSLSTPWRRDPSRGFWRKHPETGSGSLTNVTRKA